MSEAQNAQSPQPERAPGVDVPPTPAEAVQAALKRIRGQHGLVVHQAAIDVLTVLELQDSQEIQRVVDEIQTRPDLVSADATAIRSACGVLEVHGLTWKRNGTERIALTDLTASCLSEARER